MTINEKKKLSRNRKRRILRNIKIDEKMKSYSNKIKTEKKKKNKINEKFKNLEIEVVKIKYDNSPFKKQSALKKLNSRC